MESRDAQTLGTELGIFDVKTHFSEVVDRVVREGRPITVTRRGKPVVRIVPCVEGHDGPGRMTVDEALAALEELRKVVAPVRFDEIRAITDEARNRCSDT